MVTSDQLLAHATQLLATNRFAELVQFAVPFEQAWLARPAEAPRNAALFLYALGTAYRGLGSHQAAVSVYFNGAKFAMEQHNRYDLFVVLNSVAQTYFEQGEVAPAAHFAQESLAALALDVLERHKKDAKVRRTEDVEQLVKLCQYLVTIKDLAKARLLLGVAREAAEAHRHFAALGQVFDLLAAAAKQAGEAERAGLYLDEAQAARKIAGGDSAAKVKVTAKKRKLPPAQTAANAWPALPPTLENAMAAQESNRTHIRTAREALERALIHQFQAIADGLIADRILKGQEVSLRAWAAQYLTRHPKNTADIWRTAPRPDAVNAPDADGDQPAENSEALAMRKMVEFMRAKYPPDVAAYEKDFHLRIARRQVTRMKPEDLAAVTVRVYGGRVPIWQEGRINTQLARLGSSVRLMVVGADAFRAFDLLAKTGITAAKSPAFSAFLLGETSPCTSHFKAALFEYNHELAVSPYLDAGSPGFTDQCRICWRNRMFSGLTLNLELGSPITMGYSQTLFGHEVGHIIQEYGFVHPGHFASWRAVVRDDICRFAQTPQRYGDIALAFYKTFEAFELQPLLAQGLLPPGEPKDKLELVEVMRELLQDGLLERSRDDKFVSPLYDDGREWHVE